MTFAVLIGLLCGFTDDAADSSLRVMTFNIRYGTAKDGENHWDKRREFLVETIRKFAPDLLGTQETLAFQRDYLLAELKGYEAFGVGRDDGKLKGEMAALFFRKDRFERTDGGHFWLSETPEIVGSKGWDAALPRIATWVKLKDRKRDGRPIVFLNTHFDHLGKQARTRSAVLIRDRLESLGRDSSVVVTGDFNAGEGSEPYLALFENNRKAPSLVDAFRVANPMRANDEGTFNGFDTAARSGERIDWIGCSRDWKVKAAAIDRTIKDGKAPSDHFAVTAVLALSD